MRKPVLIVIAGPNGSGKTSTTRLVVKHEWAEKCVYINPDEIAQSKFGDWNDANAVRVMQFADRVYFYDNSIDDQNAQLLFRTTDGKFAKQYVNELPEWTETIIENLQQENTRPSPRR